MIVSIMQPAYLPWLGYFERIARSDVHVLLDHVQFEKNSFTNRNRIKTRSGPAWLTVPVQTAGKFGDLPIMTLRVDNKTRWTRKHLETLQQSYASTPFFKEHAAFLQAFYRREFTLLQDVCDGMTTYLLEALSITTPLVRSSTLQLSQSKSELVLEICQQLGATTYISGQLGVDYLDTDAFSRAGIKLEFQNYCHPAYVQAHGEFVSHLSVFDLLCNMGPRSLETLMTAPAQQCPDTLQGGVQQ